MNHKKLMSLVGFCCIAFVTPSANAWLWSPQTCGNLFLTNDHRIFCRALTDKKGNCINGTKQTVTGVVAFDPNDPLQKIHPHTQFATKPWTNFCVHNKGYETCVNNPNCGVNMVKK